MPKLLTNTSWCVVLGFVMVLGCVMGSTRARAGGDKEYVVFEYTTQENLRPDHVPAEEEIVDTVSCVLARDEYEPVQIGVHALADRLTNIRVTVESDLEVTVYHRIDPDIKQQLASEPETVVPGAMPSEIYLQRGEVVGELAPGSSVNFWLLLCADPETSPGLHRGRIRIKPDGLAATELDLEVRVRPFRLAAPRAVFGIWYREDMLPKRFGSWAVEDEVALGFYRDMAAHGQNSATFYHGGNFDQLPPRSSRMTERSLTLAREAGLVHPEIPVIAVQAVMVAPDVSQTQMEAAVAWLNTERSKRGWPEIVVFGQDEGIYPTRRLRERFLPLRPLPMRLSSDFTHISNTYAYGDFHDVWSMSDGLATPQMHAEAKRMGAEVWTSSYRILRGNYSPLRQRYYAGFHTWAHRLGGNFVWAYCHGHHSHVWWKPDGTEPMPVTGWEGRREGVDDYRYLQMVEDLVTANPKNQAFRQAGAWLEQLRARLIKINQPHRVEDGSPLDSKEYDAIRARAADYIQKLGPVTTDGQKTLPLKGLKDEAAAFRGRSAEECVAGLDDPDVWQRRAAAFAVFELGPRAAHATPALARLLDDPEVRFPALHALEAIGPDAYSATPEIASLLSHPDAFVRQGATFALAGIARPRNWDENVNGYAREDVSPHAHTVVPALRQALGDSHPDVVWIAGMGLSRCGQAAAPALPDAMKLFTGKPDDASVAAMRALAGMGPAAASAVPLLIKSYEDAEGKDQGIAWTLAAIGPAASDAVTVLEQYRTPENPHLADTCYALFCIRGQRSDLKTMVELLGDENRPRGDSEWRDVIRFLHALGAQAAPVAPLAKERLPFLDSKPELKRQLKSILLERLKKGESPLRLLPR